MASSGASGGTVTAAKCPLPWYHDICANVLPDTDDEINVVLSKANPFICLAWRTFGVKRIADESSSGKKAIDVGGN